VGLEPSGRTPTIPNKTPHRRRNPGCDKPSKRRQVFHHLAAMAVPVALNAPPDDLPFDPVLPALQQLLQAGLGDKPLEHGSQPGFFSTMVVPRTPPQPNVPHADNVAFDLATFIQHHTGEGSAVPTVPEDQPIVLGAAAGGLIQLMQVFTEWPFPTHEKTCTVHGS